MEPITIEVLPVDASMSGKNTFYHSCDMLGRRSNYGLCLFTIKAFNDGKLSESSPCYEHVARGQCDALRLQAQEQQAGRALFFKAREETIAPSVSKPERVVTKPVAPHDASYMRGWEAAGRKPVTKSKAKPKTTPKKPKSVFGTASPTLADAVNVAAKESAAKSKKSTAGMSLMERARLMREKK